MSARIYVDRIDPRVNEGSRLLWQAIKRAGSQTALRKSIGVAAGCLGRWLRGEQKPSAKFRVLLRAHGIPLDAWDNPPRKPFSLSAHAA